MIEEELFLFFIISIGVVLATGFILFMVTRKISRHKLDYYKKTGSSSLIYIIDFNTEEVVYFNRRSINNKVTSNLTRFLDFYPQTDGRKILDWFNQIQEKPEEAEKYLEVETKFTDKKSKFTLFTLKKYSKRRKVLYFDATLLMNLNVGVDIKRGHLDKKNIPINKAQLKKMYQELQTSRGYLYALKLYPKNIEVFGGEVIPKNIMLNIKDDLFVDIKEKPNARYFIEEKDNRILIFDFKQYKLEDAYDFAEKIAKTLGASIKTKGYYELCGYSIGIAKYSDFVRNFEGLIDSAKEASDIAQNNNLPYMLYEIEKTVNFEESFNRRYAEDLFSPTSMKFEFRPIVSVQNLDVFGYFSYVKTLNGAFNGYNDMVDIAYKLERSRELFTKVSRTTVQKFASHKKTVHTRLFLSASLVDLSYINSVLTDIPTSESLNIVLLFEEDEVNAHSMSQDILLKELSDLDALGYELALSMKSEDLLLTPEVYHKFSYFVIGSSMVSKVRVSNRIKLSNRFLVEQLMQFKRPIIATDLDGWPSVELFVKSGIKYLSSNDISPIAENITPVDKRKLLKIGSYLTNE